MLGRSLIRTGEEDEDEDNDDDYDMADMESANITFTPLLRCVVSPSPSSPLSVRKLLQCAIYSCVLPSQLHYITLKCYITLTCYITLHQHVFNRN